MMKKEDVAMDPDASPNDNTENVSVRKLNNLPLVLLLGALAIFLILIMVVASHRAQQPALQETANKPPKMIDNSSIVNQISGSTKGGIIAPQEILHLKPASDVKMVNKIEVKNHEIEKEDNLTKNSTGLDDEIARIKLKNLEEALKSKTNVSFSLSTNNNRQSLEYSDEDQFNARLMKLKHSSSLDSPYLLTNEEKSNRKNNYDQFSGNDNSDRWTLESKLINPKSPYQVQTGFIIPATLVSGINSDLPGQILAQVSQPVYDSPTGNFLLIPQGSRLIGSYSSEISYGQSRILIAWQRIIFPDGKNMDIGAMPGADGAGYAGLNDQVNNHFVRVISSAFLMSGVTAGLTMSQKKESLFTAPTAGSALSEALGQQLGDVTARMIAKNLNIAPTLEIRPGFRFNVIVIKDMLFSKPYQSFDY